MKQFNIFEFAKQYQDYPSRKSEYKIDGKQYIIHSHFVGSKDIDKVIYEAAFICALNEVLKTEKKICENAL